MRTRNNTEVEPFTFEMPVYRGIILRGHADGRLWLCDSSDKTIDIVDLGSDIYSICDYDNHRNFINRWLALGLLNSN